MLIKIHLKSNSLVVQFDPIKHKTGEFITNKEILQCTPAFVPKLLFDDKMFIVSNDLKNFIPYYNYNEAVHIADMFKGIVILPLNKQWYMIYNSNLS